jgi:hypothetical protein
MDYTTLGRTGLLVSRLCFGTMTFGDGRGLFKAIGAQQAPPGDPRGGILQPIEGGRWLLSLIGGDGDYPPTDEAGFLAFARSLRSPALHEAIAAAEPLTPIVGHRATENRLRHYGTAGCVRKRIAVRMGVGSFSAGWLARPPPLGR